MSKETNPHDNNGLLLAGHKSIFNDGQRRARRLRSFALLTVVSLCGWAALRSFVVSDVKLPPQGCSETTNSKGFVQTDDFNWTSITPSEELKWVRCFDKFECARLSVPLDYSEPTGERAAVALAKLPSKIPPGQEGYRGPVLFNPGGPGGSGVQTIRGRGDFFRTILGDDYDLIGFDPRGIGATTPSVAVFPTKSEQGSWVMQKVPIVNATSDALGIRYGRSQVLGKLADDRIRRAAEHVSTPVVARDMLSITKAHGRDKLLYWGFSYGTVLGATYAAMFPDNIERLIIDGVVDSENYYAALWSNNLRDTDAVLHNLYASCVAAGPDACTLYENSTSLVQARVARILDGLKIAPASFYNAADGTYDIIDASTTSNVIFRTMYNTHTMGKNLTIALSELEKGNAAPIWKMSDWAQQKDLLECDCGPVVPPLPTVEATYAVACGDGPPVHDGIPELQKYFENLAKNSSFADNWMNIRTACSGWKIQGKEQFTGSFIQNTSHPLLIIGNTMDPVTPLWNAHKISKGFKDSVVLTQSSPGHCSLAATSLCTTKHIRQYFRNGTLPPPDTTCDVESSIFSNKLAVNLKALSLEDQELLQAAHSLQNDYFIPKLL